MVKVTTEKEGGTEQQAEVHEAIARFEQWFVSRKNDPLSGPEKAIISTFCWYMTHVDQKPGT